ncbi:MAG: ATP-dependent sacrificial sulfur transferase LarE [Anaerolineae bacterium]|nr:ATP-dependent sacrificial sulfur transferase LarE [Anaerolineae bacterium]
MKKIDQTQQVLLNKGLPADLIVKWQKLQENLSSLDSAAVAYSGGVDSTFLAYAAYVAMDDKMCAVLIQSEVEADAQLEKADLWAREAGFKYVRVFREVLKIPQFASNPTNRCYFCKTSMLHLVKKYARENGYSYVLEGQNMDDQQDYRPGQKAVTEQGALSPLKDAGLTKADIRALAHALDLPVWDQPSSPCLASRFPYGHNITREGLERVMKGEAYLREWGFREMRVRIHEDIARIEVSSEQIGKLLELSQDITRYFKTLGFLYVTLDLQGYRQGSLNEGLKA